MNWDIIVVAIIAAVGPMLLQLIVWKRQDRKLVVIHQLVNSNMTAMMQDSLDSTIREKAALVELRESRKDLGKEPTKDSLLAIAMAEAKIQELKTKLSERQ